MFLANVLTNFQQRVSYLYIFSNLSSSLQSETTTETGTGTKTATGAGAASAGSAGATSGSESEADTKSGGDSKGGETRGLWQICLRCSV